MTHAVENYPLLRAAAHSPARFDAAIECVRQGCELGSIRNADFQRAKQELSRVADDAWKVCVSDPYFYGGKWESWPKDVTELYDSIMILSLHDVHATAKKVAKSKATGAAVDAMRAYCAEVLPVAEAVTSLKSKVVMGRAPKAEPAKPVNPSKVVKTCAVCFRPIAVVGETMAHHGYKRPGEGWQTASCAGVRFKPLEVSSEGLRWLIGALRERHEGLGQSYEQRATHPEFLLHRAGGRAAPAVKVMRGEPLWPQLFERHLAETLSERAAIEFELPRLEKLLADWKPGES